jgi:membrane protease YdiL (CAAX protease family)
MSAFLAQAALGRGARWHYAVGLVLILALWFGCGVVGYLALFQVALPVDSWTGSYLALNLPFVPLIPLIALVIRFWHRRPVIGLVTAHRRIAWGRMAATFVAALVLVTTLSWLSGEEGDPDGTLADVLRALPWILVLTPIQAAGEEVLFRGYLVQAAAAFTRSKAAIVLVNAVLFGGLHALNPEALVSPVFATLGYALAGAGLAWVAIRDDGIELTIGAHVANNLVSFLLIAWQQLPFERVGEHYDAATHYLGILALIAAPLAIAQLRPRAAPRSA